MSYFTIQRGSRHMRSNPDCNCQVSINPADLANKSDFAAYHIRLHAAINCRHNQTGQD